MHLGTLSQLIGKVPVAVKSPKLRFVSEKSENIRSKRRNIMRQQRKLLKDELKIMTHLQAVSGGHENVLKLVGAITTSRTDFCILTEYCEWGSMDHFLRKKFNNGEFENEIICDGSATKERIAISEQIWMVCYDMNRDFPYMKSIT